MEDIDLKIDTSQFDAMLAKLPLKVAGKIMEDALQAGGDVLLESMKALCPERTDEPTPDSDSLPPGILREDLHTDVKVSPTKGARLRVGPTALTGHVARWIENGWMLTLHNKKQVRQIPGKQFMVASVDEAGEAAVDAFVQALADGLNSVDDDGETL